MINVALKGGEINGSALILGETFQKFLSNILMLVCLGCVPLMLFVKPIYLNNKNKKHDEEVH